MNRLLFSIIITLCSLTAQSQTFLDSLRKDEPGKGSVSVTQSPEIDNLVNGTGQDHSGSTAKEGAGHARQSSATQQHHEDGRHDSASSESHTHEGTSSTTPSTTTEETVIDTRKKVMRNSYKTQGYRIQVFSGGNSRADRQKAESAGMVMKSNFPTEPIYVHFYSPSWKCRMGNYKTLEEAQRMLAMVKKLGYKQACIVKGTISVQY
ncbi:MAG: SPOR domain-containing protein [Prevotellaceae bacterium]|nr:SPOR domain-containing protein [Prevotellaceae bacterium]MDY2749730.1 SPOR domain-containing protein [Prevotella sp.]